MTTTAVHWKYHSAWSLKGEGRGEGARRERRARVAMIPHNYVKLREGAQQMLKPSRRRRSRQCSTSGRTRYRGKGYRGVARVRSFGIDPARSHRLRLRRDAGGHHLVAAAHYRFMAILSPSSRPHPSRLASLLPLIARCVAVKASSCVERAQRVEAGHARVWRSRGR